MNLFRKKLPQPQTASALRKSLSAWDLTFLGVGNMIGAGIFVLTGVAAAQAGPAIILSFLIAGFACAFVALSYAELAACIGGCGSVYGYSYATFGELVAWIVGWTQVIGLGIALAAVANGWSGYVESALASFGLGLPLNLMRGPAAGGFLNLPAMAVIFLLMILLFAGVKQSARTNAIIVVVKVLALAIFIGTALFFIKPDLLRPFMPHGWYGHGTDGKIIGVLPAAAIVFFAFSGFQGVAAAVEEARNPGRDVPIGTLAALAICTAIYIAVAGLLTATVPHTALNVSSPIAFALLQLGFDWGAALVAIGVIVGLTSTMLVQYYRLTRVLFAMSRDGLLPSFLCRIDSKRGIPVNATLLCGLVAAPIAGLVSLGTLAQLATAGILMEFILTCGGVIVLRVVNPDMPRPFKAPGGIALPILGVALSAALMSWLPPTTLLRFGLWIALGVAVYFGYTLRQNRAAARKPSDELAA